MSGNFTTMVETAREMLKILQASGLDPFLRVLRGHADIVSDDAGGDPRAMNTRFMALVYGFLSILYVHDDERIARRQIAIVENFINEPSPPRKVECFVRDLGRFFAEYEEEKRGRSVTEAVKMFLTACPCSELKRMTVQSVAERFGYNPNYLSSRFRKEQTYTLQEAIQNEKMNRAYLALKDEETRLTVKELSWNLGFSDSAYFSQLFKAHFGLLPTQARQGG